MAIDKVFYNKSSADSLGWTPEWFGAKYHDEKLVSAIRKWQRKNGLTADGLCGPTTYRRIWTERQADIDDYIYEAWAEGYIQDDANYSSAIANYSYTVTGENNTESFEVEGLVAANDEKLRIRKAA